MNPLLYSTLPGLPILGLCAGVVGPRARAVTVLPRAWREKRADSIRALEGTNERIGITGPGGLFGLTSLSLRFGSLPFFS